MKNNYSLMFKIIDNLKMEYSSDCVSKMKIKKLEPSCNLLIVHENLDIYKKYHIIKNISLK